MNYIEMIGEAPDDYGRSAAAFGLLSRAHKHLRDRYIETQERDVWEAMNAVFDVMKLVREDMRAAQQP